MSRASANRFGIIIILFFIFETTSMATRSVLVWSSFSDIDTTLAGIVKVFFTGLIYDIAAFSYLVIPFTCYLVLMPVSLFRSGINRCFLYATVLAGIWLLVFTGVAEFFFWDEFGTRFNFIAVDYLVYTNEVLGNIRESYPLTTLFTLTGVASLLLFAICMKPVKIMLNTSDALKQRAVRAVPVLSLSLICYACINTAVPRVSENKYNNNLAANGIYTLFSAFRNNSLNYYEFYATRSKKKVFNTLHKMLGDSHTGFTDDSTGFSVQRIIKNNGGKEKQYNVILIMMESMSAEYLGGLGNTDTLTPNLDRLAENGLLFTNFYATGTRTVRGMEAVCLSLPPTPGRSIVKRPHNENLFSIGTVFKQKGYENKFIYGGYGYFDNMNYFFSHNGFQIVDRTKLSKNEISFANIWGVCDEDLLGKVIKEADKSFNSKNAFFFFVMTTSNHRPYTFPA